jgi:hypothetical protein
VREVAIEPALAEFAFAPRHVLWHALGCQLFDQTTANQERVLGKSRLRFRAPQWSEHFQDERNVNVLHRQLTEYRRHISGEGGLRLRAAVLIWGNRTGQTSNGEKATNSK